MKCCVLGSFLAIMFTNSGTLHLMYAGGLKPSNETDKDDFSDEEKIKKFESPVNLFSPNWEKYPNLQFAKIKYSEHLIAGDCVFIPAYYFYQTAAEAEIQ